ncbi:MAG: PQQ-like beta-propeller repeat protein [Planctomycetales bacterium]|nr:PQQ-like beta-propeller repeat protein [Planctomycetales bacterium]
MRFQTTLVANLVLGALGTAKADDWPQWLGPNRDGVYREAGIVESIPDEGLPICWRVSIGKGYSGPAVAQDKVVVTDYVVESGTSTNNPGGKDEISGRERILCLDVSTGEMLWKHEYPCSYNMSFANGPRATPTIQDGLVYVLGAEGNLTCLSLADGQVVWSKQLNIDFDGETPFWGHAAHPLVRGDLLYVLTGGMDHLVVALDRNTGEEIWHALSSEEMGYCPPTIISVDGREQLLIWHATSLNSLDPDTGSLNWTYPLAPRYGMAIAAPRLFGRLLYVCGIGETAAMIELDASGQPARTLWTGKPKMGLYAGNGTPLFADGMILGADCGVGFFAAIDPADGRQFWTTFELTTGGDRRASHGTAFVVSHQPYGQLTNRFFLFAETGELIDAELTRESYKVRGRMRILEPTGTWDNRNIVWSHPAFSQQKIFARNDQEIVCVDLSATK